VKKLSTVVLVVLAVIFAVLAVIYFSKTAGSLPHFLPGHLKGSTHKHLKHGIACLVVAVVCLLGAWMTTGKSESAKTEKEE
jgi:amino acid permease